MKMRVVLIGAATLVAGGAALALMLAAFSGPPPANAGKAPTTGAQRFAAVPAPSTPPGATAPIDPPAQLAPDGKPIWAPNRKHTAEENADYQFDKNGGDFGAHTEADFVRAVHAFIDAPPADVEQMQRSNGDRLLYDPKTNTFAVVTSTGAPRTMFKPRDGAAYWQQQVQRENEHSSGDSSQG